MSKLQYAVNVSANTKVAMIAIKQDLMGPVIVSHFFLDNPKRSILRAIVRNDDLQR
jgi:hypothetical protein